MSVHERKVLPSWQPRRRAQRKPRASLLVARRPPDAKRIQVEREKLGVRLPLSPIRCMKTGGYRRCKLTIARLHSGAYTRGLALGGKLVFSFCALEAHGETERGRSDVQRQK
jgi:hypothetical protein